MVKASVRVSFSIAVRPLGCCAYLVLITFAATCLSGDRGSLLNPSAQRALQESIVQSDPKTLLKKHRSLNR